MAGQPRILTPEVIAEYKELLPVALYMETVSDYLGIERSTAGKWLKRGAKEARRLARFDNATPDPDEDIYLQFFHTHKRAIADGMMKDLRRIAEVGQWQACAWRLERRAPDQWGTMTREVRELEKRITELEAQLAAHETPA